HHQPDRPGQHPDPSPDNPARQSGQVQPPPVPPLTRRLVPGRPISQRHLITSRLTRLDLPPVNPARSPIPRPHHPRPDPQPHTQPAPQPPPTAPHRHRSPAHHTHPPAPHPNSNPSGPLSGQPAANRRGLLIREQLRGEPLRRRLHHTHRPARRW